MVTENNQVWYINYYSSIRLNMNYHKYIWNDLPDRTLKNLEYFGINQAQIQLFFSLIAGKMRVLTILLILEISVVNSLPFLSNEAKEDFDKSNKALIEMQRRLNKTLSSLDSNGKKLTDAISTVVGKPFDTTKKALTIIQNIMRKAGKDFTDLGKDLKSKIYHFKGFTYYIFVNVLILQLYIHNFVSFKMKV